jgi:hypothetical protein
MKVEITYPARVVNSVRGESAPDDVLIEIGTYDHLDAEISRYFKEQPKGLTVSGGGIRFCYDKARKVLNTIAVYEVDAFPSELQLSVITESSNDMIDLGFYGEDGWFVDVGNQSFYITLWDKEIDIKPTTIKVIE